jgi:hypothetical protein
MRFLRSNESGLALIAVLLAMALLTAIGAALTAVGIVEFRTSVNHRSATRALLLADAGATHALALMRGPLAGYSYTDVLLGSDGVAGTEDDGLFVGFDLSETDALPNSGIGLGQGRYFVRMVNDDTDPSGDPYTDANHRFVALCRGETPDGGVAEVRVMLAAPSFPAVAANGDLYVPGTPTITATGPCGGIHANNVIVVDGHPTVDGDVTYSEGIVMSGVIYDSHGNEVIPRYEDPIKIDEYLPRDFCDDADYRLEDKKLITVGPPPDTSSINGEKVLGWEWEESENAYVLNANDAVEGTVCAYGDIRVNGNLGEAGNPFSITLIATGSIRVGGTPVITADHPDGILILAGGDVQIGGTASTTTPYYRGLVYAGSQCQVNGDPVVDGHILCNDAEDPTGAANITDENKINGTPTINYDCNGVRRHTLVSSWWELRTS